MKKRGGKGKKSKRRRAEDAPEGFDDVIRRRLFMVNPDDIHKTLADTIADVLIQAAVKGDLKSVDMLGRRVGEAPDVPDDDDDDDDASDIDDEIARRILEAARGPVKSRSRN